MCLSCTLFELAKTPTARVWLPFNGSDFHFLISDHVLAMQTQSDHMMTIYFTPLSLCLHFTPMQAELAPSEWCRVWSVRRSTAWKTCAGSSGWPCCAIYDLQACGGRRLPAVAHCRTRSGWTPARKWNTITYQNPCVGINKLTFQRQ